MADLEGLREFEKSRGGSRGKAEFFVGRKEEMDALESACVEAIKRKSSPDRSERENDPGGLLFTGAPGAGKTAILAEALQRTERMESVEGGIATPRAFHGIRERLRLTNYKTPLVINTAPAELRAENALAGLCSRKASEVSIGAQRDAWAKAVELLSAPVAGIDGSGLTGRIREIDVLERPLVLVLIDEAQNSNESNGTIYESLHLGLHPLPVVPLFVGLSNSRARLKEAGISRFANGHVRRLDPLSEEECGEAMRSFIERYGVEVRARDLEFWETFASDHSRGFAHHLNDVLVTASACTRERNGRLESAMGAKAARIMGEKKSEYYELRTDGFDLPELNAAALIVEDVVDRGENPHYAAARRFEEVPIEAPDVNGFVDRMVRSGMLQELGMKRFECPIPSFSEWLKAHYGSGQA